MADARFTPFQFTPPTADEAQALRVAGDYLVRAGAEASRRLLAAEAADAEWLATVTDGLLAGAVLCAELIETPN